MARRKKCPDLVSKCIKSIYENFDSKYYNINIITKDNINEFCNFPDYIYEKVDKKIITLTHFSDLVRTNLLYTFGGLWIDATVYVTKKIPNNYFDNYDFFTIKNKDSTSFLYGRWTGFFLYAKKGYPLFKFMYDSFIKYWRENNYLMTYLFIDYLIAVYYEISESFRNDLNKIDKSNNNLYYYLRKMNKIFNINEWNNMQTNTFFFKLSYKDMFNGGPLKTEKNHQMTNWGYIYNNEKK